MLYAGCLARGVVEGCVGEGGRVLLKAVREGE
jgi:hypothetical protein